MPLKDDGDIVKGLGFVTLYAAYLEESVDACTQAVINGDATPPSNWVRWSARQKLKYCEEQLEPLARANAEIDHTIQACSYCLALLEERNEVIHGRIYGGLGDEPDVRKSGRAGVPDKPISSKELYDLANRLFEAQGPLLHAAEFAIPRALARSK